MRWTIMFLSLAVASPAMAQQLFFIVDPLFSSSIRDDGTYAPVEPFIEPGPQSKIPRSALSGGTLYFSFTIVGTEETLRYADQQGGLAVMASIWADGSSVALRDVGLTSPFWFRDRAALFAQARREKFFKWRTFAITRQIQANFIEIGIADQRRNNVKPLGFGGASYSATINIAP